MKKKISRNWRTILGFLVIMAGLAFSDWMYIGVPIVIVGLGLIVWQTVLQKKGLLKN